MNARETMQALLDGKIVTDEWGYKLKLSDQGTLMINRLDGTWRKAVDTLNDDLQIFEEYPLTFEEALKAMLDGKVIQPKRKVGGLGHVYRLNNGAIEVNCEMWGWEPGAITHNEQKGKWKVVE